ncbi:hypothetical protein JTB14_023464 [Gonioctena quinquepunctata]|nr:hypothetical protein JTB14_023464 [Gonioctena quinquepunctata]
MTTAIALIDSLFGSESDSEDQFEFEMISPISQMANEKSVRSLYMKKRETHGKFALTKEFSDEKFTNYFRLNRDQFKEVHEIIKKEIDAEGCNATRPIRTEEKLAVFLK